MKGISRSPLAAAAAAIAIATANAGNNVPPDNTIRGIEPIVKALRAAGGYSDTVRFTVGMPQLSDDVVYTVALSQQPADGDPLLPCSYLIDWELTGRDEPVRGFSAYFWGNHYRYSARKLQEYHYSTDSMAFRPREIGQLKGEGVQRTAQFASLLPALLADEIERQASDTAYSVSLRPDTLVGGVRRTGLRIVRRLEGDQRTASEAEMIFDRATLLPVSLHYENSPGTVSEQTVDAVYGGATLSADTAPLTEDRLIALYPDIFASYRRSNFRVESLPGQPMPGFSLPTLTGERYSRRASDRFAAPTVIAILDPDGGFTQAFIEGVRQGVAQLPFAAEIIWAFTGSHGDTIEGHTGPSRMGETTLISARGLARDCGAATLPVAVICGKDGTVADIIVGFNNNLAADVIQKTTIAGQ